MVFAEENLQIDLWRISLRSGDLQPLTRDEAVESLPSLSADGSLAAFVSGRFGHTDVWIKNLATGKDAPLTATSEEKYAAVISPTGRDVYFSMVRNGRRGIYSVPSTGGVPEQVADGELSPTDVSGDSRFVVLQYRVNAPLSAKIRNLTISPKASEHELPTDDAIEIASFGRGAQ